MNYPFFRIESYDDEFNVYECLSCGEKICALGLERGGKYCPFCGIKFSGYILTRDEMRKSISVEYGEFEETVWQIKERYKKRYDENDNWRGHCENYKWEDVLVEFFAAKEEDRKRIKNNTCFSDIEKEFKVFKTCRKRKHIVKINEHKIFKKTGKLFKEIMPNVKIW